MAPFLNWTPLFEWYGMWFGEDPRANIMKTRVQRDWTTFSNTNIYFTLNSEQNWEDLCIQSINQQTHTSDNHY